MIVILPEIVIQIYYTLQELQVYLSSYFVRNSRCETAGSPCKRRDQPHGSVLLHLTISWVLIGTLLSACIPDNRQALLSIILLHVLSERPTTEAWVSL